MTRRSVTLSMMMMIALFAVGRSSAAAPSKDTWLVILGGGASEADARGAVAAWPRMAGPLFTVAAGFPRILLSDSVKGLKPGFSVAVAGACGDAPSAERVRDLLRLTAEGVYVRRVQGFQEESCPKIVGMKPSAGSTHPLGEKRLEGSIKHIDWQIAWSGPEIHIGRRKFYTDLSLTIITGDTVLGALSLVGGFTPDERGMGVGVLRSPEFVTLGRRAFVLVDVENREGYAATGQKVLYGFVGGAIRKVGHFMPHVKLVGVGDDWRELRAVEPNQPVAEGQYFRFDETAAFFVPAQPGSNAPSRADSNKPPIPLILEGCDADEDCCITSEKLTDEAAVLRTPVSAARTIAKLKARSRIFKAEVLRVLDVERSKIEVLDVDDCENAPENAPTKEAYYLFQAEEGRHHVWMNGSFTEVHDDCLAGRPEPAMSSTWVRVTLKDGRVGYVDGLASFEQSATKDCLYGRRAQPIGETE